MLLGLAYRILGSRADAEDAVQDTFIKWQSTEQSEIENPAAWLTTACTRRCIDLARAAHKTRVEYVGAWLPEPIQTSPDEQDKLALAGSLQTAFLLVLERLTPRERAAYLLHEIFDVPYPEVARTLDMQEPACRKLVSRAKATIDQAKVRHVTPVDRQEQLLAAFEEALAAGSTDRLSSLLSNDIQLAADGGGKVAAAARILQGKDEVLAFFRNVLLRFWPHYEREVADINGTRGFIFREAGVVVATVAFGYADDGSLTNIFIMRNPDKLARV
jgi:RNA polymerase sigma factor (sigma-70 family)